MSLEQLRNHDDSQDGDNIVVLHGATWADYQRVLELRGDHSAPRINYLEGELEIMSPGKMHESIACKIGRLVEVWCLENEIPFEPVGSWTIQKKSEKRGAEPDECYVFGDLDRAKRPDLAIEVVWSSGGVDKLDIYRKLGVREVWFWERAEITVYLLRGQRYVAAASSRALPGIDLVALAGHLAKPTHEAIRAWRAAVLRQLR